ncbi:hypothetical protein [Pseudoalteromonas sp. T1lg24]|nr:hypothetical protein [Pseudoalteromonas sp. T1lg24]
MNKLVHAILLTLSLSACAEQAVDCSVFEEQAKSKYILPFKKG